MSLLEFNPFEDRLCRDIRNDLSESFLEVLNARSCSPAEQVADGYRQKDLPESCRDYLALRLKRYQKVLESVAKHGDGTFTITAITWDQQLFFEVHEVLEPEWLKASATDKLVLQALIRAAGVYLNLELDYTARARKISLKAIPVLKKHQDLLAAQLNVVQLIAALERLDPVAPELLLRQPSQGG